MYLGAIVRGGAPRKLLFLPLLPPHRVVGPVRPALMYLSLPWHSTVEQPIERERERRRERGREKECRYLLRAKEEDRDRGRDRGRGRGL